MGFEPIITDLQSGVFPVYTTGRECPDRNRTCVLPFGVVYASIAPPDIKIC